MLEVGYCEPRESIESNGLPCVMSGWSVCLPLSTAKSKQRVLVWGFGRKQDAEIAARVLSQIGIDTSLPVERIREIWNANGARCGLMKKICENLQW